MYIAVTTYTIQPERKEEIVALLRDQNAAQASVALMMQVPGVTGYYALVNPETGEGLTLILYATEAQAKAGQSTAQGQAYATAAYTSQVLSSVAPGSMHRQIYEVAAHG